MSSVGSVVMIVLVMLMLYFFMFVDVLMRLFSVIVIGIELMLENMILNRKLF